jgi:hypothetical protein
MYKKAFTRKSTFLPNSDNKLSKTEVSNNLKNDLQIAFNLFKNEKNLIPKVKLRTLIYSFLMYKLSPKDINEFIYESFDKQEEFSFEDLINLINPKWYFIIY